jgi:2-keto-4-pentenoate hydratase
MPSEETAAEVHTAMTTLLATRAAALAGGAEPVGWKIGINVVALQEHFGLDGPVVGYLSDVTVIEAGTPVDLTGWQRPMLEVEVAARVGPDGGLAALAPALELVDLDLPFEHIGPILEGNVFHRGVIFGPERAGHGSDLDLTTLEVAVTRSAAVVATGSLTEAPARTIEVVRAFLERHGGTLEPGQRIICGSLITPLPIEPGEQLEVDFGPLGSLTLTLGSN